MLRRSGPRVMRCLAVLAMLAVLGVSISACTVSAAAPAPPPPGPLGIPGAWRSVFHDEFTGSDLDTTKWSTGWFGAGVTAPVRAKEPACYDPDNVWILQPAQQLAITLERNKQTCGGKTRAWTTGLVTTNGKFSFSYGALEARLYLPAADDDESRVVNWPAFWSTGQNWPDDGENDVLESLDGAIGPHFHSPEGGPGFAVPGSWTGWHTFGSAWEPGRVTYFYDGRQVGEITTGITGSPMYLVLGYGPSSQQPSSATMLVDYVRVWQH